MTALANSLAVSSARGPYVKLRPKVSGYEGNYRIWWKYAYQRALDLVRLRRKTQSWENVKRSIRIATRYSWLYKHALGVLPLPALSDAEQDELVSIQDSQPLHFLQSVNKATTDSMQKEVKKMLHEAAEAPQAKPRGLFSRINPFGSSYSHAKITIGGVEVEVSQEQLQQMKSFADSVTLEGQEAESENTSSPNEYIKMSLQLSLGAFTVDIVKVEQNTGERERILYAGCEGISAALSKRKQGFLAKASITSAIIEGKESCRIMALDASPELVKKSVSMMELNVEGEPLNSNMDLSIGCTVLPVIFALQHEIMGDVLDWVEDVQDALSSHASLIAQQARDKLSQMAQSGISQTSEFAKLYAAPNKRVKLTLSLAAPTLLAPCLSSGLGGDEPSILVVNLGHLLVDTHEAKDDNGDKYKVNINNVNVYLCATEDWKKPEDAREHALFTSPVSANLTFDKPTPSRPEATICMHVASIDVRVTKAHVLHAFALQDTLAVFANRQASLIVKKDVKGQLELSEDSAKTLVDSPMESKEANEKRMQVEFTVESLSVTFAATEEDAEQGDTWAQAVTPEKSLQLEMIGLGVHFKSWTTNANLLEARLSSIVVRHLEQGTGAEDKTFDILCTKRDNISWRHLLLVAESFEEKFRQVDKDGSGTLDIGEVQALLQSVGIRVQDSQLDKLNAKLDANKDGQIDLEEFVQLSGLLASNNPLEKQVPVPSTILREDMTFLTCTINHIPDARGQIVRSTSVKMARIEIQVSSFPLRNVVDWQQLLTKKVSQATSKSSDEDVLLDDDEQPSASPQTQSAGIAALRMSFESPEVDIYVPPKDTSTFSLEIDEVDMVVHDLLIDEAALYFRVGPMCVAISANPTNTVDPYQINMQIVLERLRIHYGRSKWDLDCDLEDILAETNMTFSRNQTMPHELSGVTQEDGLAVSDNGVVFQVSLRHMLFLKAVQKVLGDALQGSAGGLLKKTSCSTSSTGLQRRNSSRRMLSRNSSLARSSSFAGGDDDVVQKKKYLRNINRLTRSFRCTKLIVFITDDLPDIQEPDFEARTDKIKIFEFLLLNSEISENVDRQKPEAEVHMSTTMKVQAESVHTSKNMETLLEGWKFNVYISTSRASEMQRIVVIAPEHLEFTATPDHIERPRLTNKKFQHYVEKQELFFKLQLKSKMEEGFKDLQGASLTAKLSALLADLNPGAKRKIRNQTDFSFLLRIYDAGACNTLTDSVIAQAVLRPGASIAFPKEVLARGMMLIQPSHGKVVEKGGTDESNNDVNAGSQQIVWSMGSFSKPESLGLAVAASDTFDKGTPFLCHVTMIVHLSMADTKAKSILTDSGQQRTFKLAVDRAMRCEREHVMKRVVVCEVEKAGPGIVLIHLEVSLGTDSISGGILFDCAADLSQNRLAYSFMSGGLIESADQLSVVKEPAFERSIDCSSPQLPKTFFFVTSKAKQIQITAPWKLCNVLPKPAIFNVYEDDNPDAKAISTVELEAGQEMRQPTPLTADASLWVTVDFDGYTSSKHKISRQASKRECMMQTKSGSVLSCSLETSTHASTEFLVVFSMCMVIINRSGLSLSFGRCRKPQTSSSQEEVEEQSSREENRKLEVEEHLSKKSVSRTGDGSWVVYYEEEHKSKSWNKNVPEIIMLHLPEGGWSPCVKMAADSEWQQWASDGDDTPMATLNLTGPPPVGGPEGHKVKYTFGVWLARGIAPFTRTVYVNIVPKCTVSNRSGLTLQFCDGGEDTFTDRVYGQVSDMCSLSTFGLFRVAPAATTAKPKRGFELGWGWSSATEEKEAKSKRKLRIRLIGEDGLPQTRLSEPFTLEDNEKSMPLRLLDKSDDISQSVSKAIDVIVSLKKWEAAIFVEINNTINYKPMYQVTNSCISSNSVVKIWQPESSFGERYAILVRPGETVPFSFDDPDVGAKVTFSVQGCSPKTINAKHPSQDDFVQKGKSIKYMTSVSGYTRKLKIYDGKHGSSEDQKDQKDVSLLQASVSIPGAGFSLLALDRIELLYASIHDVKFSQTVMLKTSETTLRVAKLQIDNPTPSGPEVVFKAGSAHEAFLDCTVKKRIEVTAMPYFEMVKVTAAPFIVEMHEVWLQYLLNFESDAMGDGGTQEAAVLEVSDKIKYRRRALIGVPREREEELEILSFLGKGVKLRQQFFEEFDLEGVKGKVTVRGLSSIALRDPVDDEKLGPISNLYIVLHGLGQKVPIPELDGTEMTLPAYKKEDVAIDAGAGLGGVIVAHYKSALISAGMMVLSSGAAWGEILMTAADSKEERLARQEQKSRNMTKQENSKSLTAGLSSVGNGFWDGLTGTVMKPIEGAQSCGFTGFFNGIGAGAVGVITKPTAGIISGTQQVSQEVVGMFVVAEQVLKRVRTPRAVFGDHVLRTFDVDNATAYWALQAEEVRLRKEGKNAQADKIYGLKHSFFGYASTLDPPAGSGLFISQHRLLLVQGTQFDQIQMEIGIDKIKSVCAVGESGSRFSIEITSTGTDVIEPLVVRVASPEKCALVVEIINKLVAENGNNAAHGPQTLFSKVR